VGAPPRLFSHPPVVPNHSVEPDMARPSTRALPLLWFSPHGDDSWGRGALGFNFTRKLNDQINSRGSAPSGPSAPPNIYLAIQFSKKIEPPEAPKEPSPRTLGNRAALPAQSRSTLFPLTSSLLYYTIQTQFLLATKSAAVITRACSSTRGELFLCLKYPSMGNANKLAV